MNTPTMTRTEAAKIYRACRDQFVEASRPCHGYDAAEFERRCRDSLPITEREIVTVHEGVEIVTMRDATPAEWAEAAEWVATWYCDLDTVQAAGDPWHNDKMNERMDQDYEARLYGRGL